MANEFNHVFETPDFRYLPVASETVIEIGDLLYLDDDGVKPASTLEWNGDLAGTQDAFARLFAGVALQASAAGEAYAIKVCSAGIFEFACASATFEVGDPVAPAKQSASNALENKIVAPASGLGIAFAYRATASQTRVLVDVHSTAIPSGAGSEQMAVFRAGDGTAIGLSETVASFEFPKRALITRMYLKSDVAPGADKTLSATMTDGANAKSVSISGASLTSGSDKHVDQSYDADDEISVTFGQTASGSATEATLVVFYRMQ